LFEREGKGREGKGLWVCSGEFYVHVTGTENLEEGEVSTVLDLAIVVTVIKLDIFDAGLVEILLTRPFKSLSPGLVSEPVADEVGITSIDQDWDLLKNTWHKAVEWLHPVPLEEEVSVDVEIAAVVTADFDAELFLNLSLVKIFADIAQGRVAQVAGILALATNIIDVLGAALAKPRGRKFVDVRTWPVLW
jgi:hypothetical protein